MKSTIDLSALASSQQREGKTASIMELQYCSIWQFILRERPRCMCTHTYTWNWQFHVVWTKRHSKYVDSQFQRLYVGNTKSVRTHAYAHTLACILICISMVNVWVTVSAVASSCAFSTSHTNSIRSIFKNNKHKIYGAKPLISMPFTKICFCCISK